MLLHDLVWFTAVVGAVWGVQVGSAALADGADMSIEGMLALSCVALATATLGALLGSNRIPGLSGLPLRRHSPTSARLEWPASEQMQYSMPGILLDNITIDVSPARHAGLLSNRNPRQCVFAAISILFVVLFFYICDVFLEDDNFRVVTNSLYRAGQLRSDEWAESYDQHNYRSVLNLRGAAASQPWYAVETEFSTEHGLIHYDFPLSAQREPTNGQLEALVSLMREAPKPLLIHCKEGADRSGLASALYLYAVDGAASAQAKKQLSLLYGHFPWLTSRTGAMDEAFVRFVSSHPR